MPLVNACFASPHSSLPGEGDTDIMVLLNVAYTDSDPPPCQAWPANDLPRLIRALEYIPKEARNFNYSRTVAISLQMGVARYLMHAVYRNVQRAVNKKCNGATFLPYSEVCQPPTATVTIEDAVFDISRGPPTILRTWNTFELLETKAKRIMSEKNIRSNFTWFLWNVHLTDFTSQCLPGGPFDRVKKFRNLYRTEYGKMSG
ncbi:uncharacterized protein LOC144149169 isoform X1 [Haemaphysalis longicornis]